MDPGRDNSLFSLCGFNDTSKNSQETKISSICRGLFIHVPHERRVARPPPFHFFFFLSSPYHYRTPPPPYHMIRIIHAILCKDVNIQRIGLPINSVFCRRILSINIILLVSEMAEPWIDTDINKTIITPPHKKYSITYPVKISSFYFFSKSPIHLKKGYFHRTTY